MIIFKFNVALLQALSISENDYIWKFKYNRKSLKTNGNCLI